MLSITIFNNMGMLCITMEQSTKKKIIDKMDSFAMPICMIMVVVTLFLTYTVKEQYPHGVPLQIIGMILTPILISGSLVFISDHLYWKQKESVAN